MPRTVFTGLLHRDASIALCRPPIQLSTFYFQNSFELFGADFMLSEDLKPWLVSISIK